MGTLHAGTTHLGSIEAAVAGEANKKAHPLALRQELQRLPELQLPKTCTESGQVSLRINRKQKNV